MKTIQVKRPINIELDDLGPYPTVSVEEYATNSINPRNVLNMILSTKNGHRIVRASPLPADKEEKYSPFLFINGGDSFVALIPNNKYKIA